MLQNQRPVTVQRGLRRLGVSRAAGVQIAVWLLLLAVVVQAHLPAPDSPRLAYYLLVLAACGVCAALLINAAGPASDAASETSAGRLAPHWAWVAGGAGVVCGIVGARLAGPDEWSAQWWWLAAMVIPLCALVIARGLAAPSSPAASQPRGEETRGEPATVSALGESRFRLIRSTQRWWVAAEAAGLFVLALIPRSINVTASPPFLLGDEAQCGLFGRLFDAGQTPLLSISWYGLPMFSYAVSGMGLRVFGDSLTGLRLTNAVVGSIGVVLTYFLGKEWFSRRAGVLAAAFLAVTFLDLELSRDGIHYIQGPTAITLSVYLCTLWIKRGGAMPALLAGISLMVAVSVYWSARIVFLLIPLMMLFVLVQDRGLLLSRWREIVWMAIGGLCACLPVIGLFLANPGSFNGHQGDVSIFSNAIDTKNHLISQYGNASKLSILMQQIWKVLTAFNSRGDASVIFGPWGKPILDTVSAALFPAAVALALLRWRRWQYLTCLAWIGMVLGASAITIDPPLWGRFASIMPAVALLLGALLAEIWERFPQSAAWGPVVAAAVIAVLGVIAFANFHAAFDDYPAVLRQTSMGPTDVGNFLAHAPGASNTVLLSDGSFYVNYEPIRFLAPDASGCTLMPGQPLSACPNVRSSTLFILLPGRLTDLSLVERARPGGRVVTVGVMNDGATRILAYELS